ncbi:S1/P1 nuclease [Pseudoalteromonas sp. C2R02]|uniref:S1/P1 nuclease n=1 Tax=Pseudoalteromonas sp. C2R02 TaxID=2841565 RepID=UPI001C09FDE9|nr:S1/P1 nuclease [Pseudoalteromonas sp. C2R02]MBU2970536.1 S1/P1 nuclease [Pseudoalteromonas sp. C2R02]
MFALSHNAHAWSQNGHRIVAKIAENHLTETTLQAILPLLEGEKLAEVSTWPDEMRSNPDEFWQKESGKYHYVNISKASDFKPSSYNISAQSGEVTDAYALILKATSVLKSPSSSLKDKRFYFKFLVHVVGDIHQPMHVGHSEDRGGNRIKVKFFGEHSNLHSLWDGLLVENQNLSFTEFAHFIDTNDKTLISKYLNSQPKDWILESFYIAQKLYDIGDGDYRYNYVYEQTPVVKKRLTQGGIRLAGLLNRIFDKSAIPLVNSLNNH